ERIDDLEPETTVRKADDLLPARRHALAPGVGDDDHPELEPLRRVDGQESDGARTLLFRNRLHLLDAGRVLLGDAANEARHVRPPQLLVRAGEPGELAHVRVAATTVPLGEDGQVVVVLDHDLLAETLEPDVPGERGEAVVPLAKGLEQALVVLREPLRHALL